MAIDFKNQTPKNTLPANGVIFGADDPNSTSPSTYTKSALVDPNVVKSISGGTTGLTPSVPTNGDVVISGTLAVANGGTGVTTKTGTGNVVLSDNPTLVAPVLGTPASGDLTNCTNLPLTTGITGVLDETHGGTGQSSYTIGDLLYASSTTALSKLPDAATGNALISGGVGAPPSWGKVGLTTHVNGTLPVANGGTGVTTLPALQAAVLPSQGGNAGKYLTTDGSTASWAGSGQMPLFYDLVTDLRLVTPTAGANAVVGGYYTDGDGGGGDFYAVTTGGPYNDNGGTIITFGGVNGASSAWLRVYNGAVSVSWFGAVGNGVADDTAKLTAAFAADTSIEIPDGYVFRITQPISVPAGRYIFSNGNGEIKIDQTAVIGGVSQSAYVNGLRLNSNCTIDGVVFRGTNVMCLTSFPSTLQAGVAIQTNIETNNVTIKNCKFYGFRSFGGAIIQIVRCNNVKILHNYFDETNWYAFDIGATIWAADCIYDGNVSYSNSDLFIGISDADGDISGSIQYPRGANHIITNNIHIKLRWKQPWDVGGRATFTGSISGTTLTVSSGLVGTVTVGQQVYVNNLSQRAIIISGSGTTWTLNTTPVGGNQTGVSIKTEIALGRHGLYAHYARGKSYSIMKGNVIGNVCRHGIYLRGSTTNIVDQLGPDTVTENILAYCGSGQLSEAGQSDNYASGIRLETTLPSLVSNNYLYKTGYFPDGTLGIVPNAADIECGRGTNDTIITYNRCIGAQGGAITLNTTIGNSNINNINITGNIIQTSKVGISLSVSANTNYIADVKILQNHITLTSATYAGSVSTAPRAIGISYDQSTAIPQTEKYSLQIQGNTVVGTGKQASFTGSINGYILTASSITGNINVGQIVAGSGAAADTTIVSPAADFVGSIATTAGGTLTVTEMISGTIVPGASPIIRGVGVTAGTTITAQLTSTEPGGALGGKGTYSVSISQTTAATEISVSNIWNISYSGTSLTVSGAMTSASNARGIGIGFGAEASYPFTSTSLISDNVLRGLNVGLSSYRFATNAFIVVPHRVLGTRVVWQRNRLVNCDTAFSVAKASGNDLSMINTDNVVDNCTITGLGATFSASTSHLGIQNGQNSSGEMLVQINGTSIPGGTTNNWYVGDRIINTAPVAGGNSGWVCVTAGTPGTWQRFGDITLSGSATYDPPNLADGDGDTTTVTVTGAALGDYVTGVSFSLNLQGITVTAWVSATNTVSVRFQNETGGTIDLGSGTLRANVMKQ